jgi:adenylate kinase family enzyme
MIMRADDGDERVRQHRLEVYARESKPLLDHYRSRPTFRSINGARAPELVAAELARAIDAVMLAAMRADSPGRGKAR